MKRLRKLSILFAMVLGLLSILVLLNLLQLGQPLAAAPRAQPDGQASTPAEPITYTVQSGDTLVSIAVRFSTTVAALQEANSLANADLIQIGQVVQIPAPGETPAATADTTPITTTDTTTATATTTDTTPTASAQATITATVTVTATESPTPEPPTPEPPTPEPPTPTSTPEAPAVWSDPDSAIELFSPVEGAVYHSPLEVIGFSQTFEGNVNMRLLDQRGAIIAERNATGGSVDGFDFFQTTLRFVTWDVQRATVEVFEISARDGSEINKVSASIIILPGQRTLDLDFPAVGDTVCSPIIVAGYANTFEANVLAEIAQRDGTQLLQETTSGGDLGLYTDFVTSLDYAAEAPQAVLISAAGADGVGLGAVDQTRVPVSLYPADTQQCP